MSVLWSLIITLFRIDISTSNNCNNCSGDIFDCYSNIGCIIDCSSKSCENMKINNHDSGKVTVLCNDNISCNNINVTIEPIHIENQNNNSVVTTQNIIQYIIIIFLLACITIVYCRYFRTHNKENKKNSENSQKNSENAENANAAYKKLNVISLNDIEENKLDNILQNDTLRDESPNYNMTTETQLTTTDTTHSIFLSEKYCQLKTMDAYLQIHHNLLKEKRDKIHPYAYKILKFWYPQTFNDCMDLWFGKDKTTDTKIISEYKHLLENNGKYENWCFSSPLECLALVILYDQFPRNVYRNDIKMYSFDVKCQQILTNALWKGFHLKLLPIHAVSFCLVLTHSESTLLQELCMKVWGEVRLSVDEKNDLVLFDGIFQKHFDVIEKFGHFPHRNKILGRDDTENETQFLTRNTFRFDLPLKPTNSNNDNNGNKGNAFQFVDEQKSD